MSADFFQELQSQGQLRIRVIPNAVKTEIQGKMADGRWKVRIQTPPHDGKANDELIQFCKKSGGEAIEIVQGKKSREKLIRKK